jgi:sugar phosphate isomerase/epimerase
MTSLVYCLNSSTIKPAPILEKIRIAAETGYKAIELWHDDIDLYLLGGGTLEDIKHAVDDHGLLVPTTIFLKGWWDNTGEAYTQAIDEIKRRLAQAAVVGAPHSIAGPPLEGASDFNYGAEQYRKLLAVGREFGVKPVMEYLGFANEVNTIAIAIEIMEKSGDPDATTVIDPFHCHRGGGGIEDIAKLKPHQIAISHFNDAPALPPQETQRDPDRVMPGDGVMDLKRYVKLLEETGYDRCISLELFREDLWQQDPQEVAKVGLEKMRSVVEG